MGRGPRELRLMTEAFAPTVPRGTDRRRRLLVLAPHPDAAAATRFRLTAYFDALRLRGVDPVLRPFVPARFAASFARGGTARVGAIIASAIASRVVDAAWSGPWDAVLVQREASMIGGAWAEKILTDLRRVPLIFDLDDAVWLDQPASRHPRLARALRSPEKTNELLSRARLTIAGSNYLASYCEQRSHEVKVLRTVVSRRAWAPLPGRLDGGLATQGTVPTIGWVGTPSTGTHLDLVIPALEALRDRGVRFRVLLVGASRTLPIEGVEIEYREWSRDREVEDFRGIDIGIAPIVDDAWSRGKSGFKAIQYMTVGVPFVTSSVGGATEFVVHGDNGLLASSTEEWTLAIERLLTDRGLRASLARSGRKLVEESLSIEAQQDRFADAISAIAVGRRS